MGPGEAAGAPCAPAKPLGPPLPLHRKKYMKQPNTRFIQHYKCLPSPSKSVKILLVFLISKILSTHFSKIPALFLTGKNCVGQSVF